MLWVLIRITSVFYGEISKISPKYHQIPFLSVLRKTTGTRHKWHYVLASGQCWRPLYTMDERKFLVKKILQHRYSADIHNKNDFLFSLYCYMFAFVALLSPSEMAVRSNYVPAWAEVITVLLVLVDMVLRIRIPNYEHCSPYSLWVMYLNIIDVASS